MKATVIEKYNSIETKERPVPEPASQEVLIKIAYASICGSDQHIFTGEFHPRTQLPLVPGHEFAGIIAKTGCDVHGLAEGDKVTSGKAFEGIAST